ncbi:hypothetical protein PENSPDRAFT_602621 [Peniophora sp. CONT]|nr:hypothetical protein PENSPDRAFT_602621 [Peniophora sp. CONT]
MPLFEYEPGQPFEQRSLPSLQELELDLYVPFSDRHRSAYTRILEAQAIKAEADRTELMNIRVPGFLLLEFISRSAILGDEPASYISTELVSLKSLEDVSELGGRYREKLVRAFKTEHHPPTPPRSPPSRPEFDTMEQLIDEMMQGSGRDSRTASNRALARDDFRCAITRHFDRLACKRNRVLVKRRDLEQVGAVPLRCCHILNEGIMQGIEHGSTDERVIRKNATAGGAMTILQLFGHGDIAEIITNKDGVHDLSNIITLRSELHALFNDLGVWFEATAELNAYEVCVHDPADMLPYRYDNIVRFRDHSGRDLPLPSPRLLTLHAVCARVAHMSGATEFFDEIDRDIEEMYVMAQDGSSARILDYALNRFSLAPSVA